MADNEFWGGSEDPNAEMMRQNGEAMGRMQLADVQGGYYGQWTPKSQNIPSFDSWYGGLTPQQKASDAQATPHTYLNTYYGPGKDRAMNQKQTIFGLPASVVTTAAMLGPFAIAALAAIPAVAAAGGTEGALAAAAAEAGGGVAAGGLAEGAALPSFSGGGSGLGGFTGGGAEAWGSTLADMGVTPYAGSVSGGNTFATGGLGGATGYGDVVPELLGGGNTMPPPTSPPPAAPVGSASGAVTPPAAGAGFGTGGLGTQAAGSALSRIIDGTATSADWASIAGTVGATGLGIAGSNAQGNALTGIYNQTRADRAPALAAYNTALQNPDTFYNSAPAMGATDAVLRKLSVQGNPADNPGSLSKAAAYNLGGYTDYLRGLSPAAFGTSGIEANLGSQMASNSGNLYNSLGYGLGNLTNPQQSLSDLLKQYNLTVGGVRT